MLTKSRLLKLLIKKQYVKLREVTEEEQPADLAELLEELDENNRLVVFRLLKKEVATEAFAYMSDEARDDLVNAFSDVELVSAIEEMSLDDAADLLEDMPAGVVKRVLEKSSRQTRESLNKLLNYPESSAGSLMTPEYVRLRKDMTVEQAFAAIRKQGENAETVYTCYVKKGGRKLEGIVSLRSLVVADDDTKVTDLMNTDYVYVSVYDDQEEVAETFKKYGFLAIPVVDNEHRLVGIITVDDILDVIEEETTEDIERMAGVMDDSDDEYLDIGVFKHVRNRLPWLIFMTVTLMITGSIISRFESVLSQVIVLVSYLPLLMGTGGNTGTQAASLVIRGLSLDEIDLRDAGRVLWKELRVSVILGTILSIFNFAKVVIVDGESPLIALTVAVSMVVVVMFAKLLGGMLPMGAKKLGIDPALMATPMISSITDMASAVTFLLTASIVLGISL